MTNVRPPTPAYPVLPVDPIPEDTSLAEQSVNPEHIETYNELVSYLRLKLQKPFSGAKITMLVASGVKYLGKIKSMSGSEKKDIVIHALRDVVNKSSYIEDGEKTEILNMIDLFGVY